MAFFGFDIVADHVKTEKVRDLFSRVTQSYDVMNDVMSGGLHRVWKDHFVNDMDIRPGDHILDAASGTGDIAHRLMRTYGMLDIRITALDLTESMLRRGRERAVNQGLIHGIHYLTGDSEALPLHDESVDVYTCAYGLRNVGNLENALHEAYRVLKPGGRFYCLEFSHMSSNALRTLYDAYSFNVIPFIGKYVARDEAAYDYLVKSIRRFPNQESFAQHLCHTGFEEVAFENLSCSITAIHKGVKL